MWENNREKGSRYEQCAAAYLIKQGFEIWEMNYRCRLGEIDMIAKEKEYICFVEVKYRSSKKQGYPMEAVHIRKQRKIFQTAECYLKHHMIPESTPCRFDVVSITDKEVTLIRNAFGSF